MANQRKRRYCYAIGALLGILLPAVAVVLIAVRMEEMPRIVRFWPLLAALGVSVATWWLQGLIVAVLARPQLQSLRVGDMARVYMAGEFVWGISPIKGAEVPYEVYLLKRLGLSVGEASTVVLTRVLLDIPVLLLGAFGGLILTLDLPKVGTSTVLFAGLTTIGALAAILFMSSKGARWKLGSRKPSPSGSGRRASGRTKTRRFFGDMRKSLALFWRRGSRTTLVYGCALTIAYWTFRLSLGPLALMAAGWSGDWFPVVVAQMLLFSFVLPLAPTPGGSGAREVGFATLMSNYVPEGQLLSATIVYAGLTHYLPVIVGAFFAGRQLWQESPTMVRGRRKAAESLHGGRRGTAVPVRSYNAR